MKPTYTLLQRSKNIKWKIYGGAVATSDDENYFATFKHLQKSQILLENY